MVAYREFELKAFSKRLIQRIAGLPAAFLACGFVCLACCMTIHFTGSGDPALPISIEYANRNPLAILFLVATPILTLITAIICRQRNDPVVCFVMIVSTIALIVIAVTDTHSRLHLGSLFVVVGCLCGTIFLGFAKEPRVLSAVFLAACFAFLFMLVLSSASPTTGLRLGYAERAWFFLFFGSTWYDFHST